jgi:hypothetical protein
MSSKQDAWPTLHGIRQDTPKDTPRLYFSHQLAHKRKCSQMIDEQCTFDACFDDKTMDD